MPCEDGCSRRGGDPASDEKRNGWRPVRSSASVSRSRARATRATELGIGSMACDQRP
jgi:hypothetical protein